MANGGGEGTPVGDPLGFIIKAQGEGLTQWQAYQEFQSAGGGMRQSYFNNLYGEVAASAADRSAAAALDPFQLPSGSDYTQWSMGGGGEYVTTVNVAVRNTGTGDIGWQQYMYKTSEPHTPAEAQLAAWQDFSDPDVIDRYGRVPVGTVTRNVYLTVPWSP